MECKWKWRWIDVFVNPDDADLVGQTVPLKQGLKSLITPRVVAHAEGTRRNGLLAAGGS